MSYIGKKNGNPNTDFLEAGGELENHDLVNVDSSGNLLVGKTDTLTTTPGTALLNDGSVIISRTSATPVQINRQSNDGDYILFRRNGTVVGSIGVEGGDIIIGTGIAGLRFVDSESSIIPRNSNGGNIDNTLDLGTSSNRWKDLYLSGGAYIGGTGSANYLDDYEEGTFTPDLQFNTGNSGMTYSNRAGYYTKIGNVVTIWGFCVLSNKGTVSGVANIANLPFTPHNAGSNHMFGTFTTANGMSSMPQTNNWVMPYYSGRMYFRYQTSTGEGNITNSHFTNSSNFGFTATYKIN